MTLFDIRDPKFWDRQAVDAEMRRVFQICHGCRMCFNYCPSFPELFDRVDAHVEAGEGEGDALTRAEMRKVADYCYQCKLCYVKCPYTPPHEWDVDIPRLLLREKAVRAREEGVTLQDRMLGDPDRMGGFGGLAPSLANASMRLPVLRAVMEKTVGIHRDRNLPPYRKPFHHWFEQNAGDANEAPPGDRYVLFTTCSCEYNETDVAAATVQVFERAGKRAQLCYERCCGMPFLDGGDVDGAVRNAQMNVEALLPHVRAGLPVVVPQPTCGYVMKHDWPDLLGTPEAKEVAAAVLDVCEYAMRLQTEGKLSVQFERPQGKIAYHAPCHLRAQNIGYKSRDLLQLIPGTEVELIEKCSAFDGTWGMKKEYFELSLKYAAKLNRAIEAAEARVVASDCALAGLNVVKGLGRTPRHPIQVLRDAYGLAPSVPYPPDHPIDAEPERRAAEPAAPKEARS